MFPLHPPDDPYLINTTIFGIPLVVRWYGVIIVGGALLAGRIAAGRAARRGYDPEHIWNMLLITLACGIAAARAYYVFFEWERFAGRPWLEIINPAGGGGGIAIHGALIGSITSGVIYTLWHKLPTLEFVDITVPTILIGQAIGRWGNFMNQEAYGRPTTLPFGVTIDADRRLPPYNDMATYPPQTLFHATFLYESLWNLAGFGLIMWLERRLRGWRRPGDLGLFYAIYYGLGRLWIEGLRTDSLCTNGVGGSCDNALRTAQVVSLLLIAGGLIGLFINHRRRLTPAEIARANRSGETPGDREQTSEESADETNEAEPGRAVAQERRREARAISGEGETTG
ncbi:MAG TPA: prolipoprotein diacylglyceryl transferase [Roseiflexaceae bacterium]|nr:prolipoprotein diacylglyceryl transferase [Roseiflexaceae bacterium]